MPSPFRSSVLLSAILLFSIFLYSDSAYAQDWWTKTKNEAIPADLKSAKILVERFRNEKPDDAPVQAYLDKDDRGEHPLIKKTNENLEKYNEDLRTIFKNYKFEYAIVSEKKTEDTEKYPLTAYKYVLKHVVYLRKYQEGGVTKHFYTYLFYFHDRTAKKDYPYIYLFDEKTLQSLETLIGYLNTL